MVDIDNKYFSDEGEDGTRTSPYTLFVSLYLVVMAFFILLNSISDTNQAKTDKALESLNKVFARYTGKTDFDSGVGHMFDFSYIVTEHFNNVEGAIKDSFQLENVKIERSGNRMRVSIPKQDFFVGEEGGGSAVVNGKKDFMDRLSGMLVYEDKGISIKVDFTVDSAGFSDEEGKKKYDLDVARAKAIIEKLLSSGVARELINGGVSFSREGNVIMKFTILRNEDEEKGKQ